MSPPSQPSIDCSQLTILYQVEINNNKTDAILCDQMNEVHMVQFT